MAPDITQVDIATTHPIGIRVPPTLVADPAILDHFPELFQRKQDRLTCCHLPSRDSTCRSSPKTDKSFPVEHLTNCDNVLYGDTSNYNTDMSVCGRGEADDLFDSEYVLPDNCQWWQQVDDLSFETPPCDFNVVDLPHFGDCLNYSNLWEDVDTFVSVVDAIDYDVTEERLLHESVYCLDTRRTTVRGLDIIWEEEE